MKYILLTIFTSLLFFSCNNGNRSKAENDIIEYAKKAGFTIKSNDIKNADPAILYCYSYSLWNKGEKDEAVFWYYVAKYRCFYLLDCSEKLQAGSLSEALGKKILVETGVYTNENIDNLHLVGGIYRIELYSTIQKVLGAKINGYGYGDLNQMVSVIDNMLVYQKENPFNAMGLDPQPVLKSKDIQDEKIIEINNIYKEQKQNILNDADKIKKTRAANGLENRN